MRGKEDSNHRGFLAKDCKDCQSTADLMYQGRERKKKKKRKKPRKYKVLCCVRVFGNRALQ